MTVRAGERRQSPELPGRIADLQCRNHRFQPHIVRWFDLRRARLPDEIGTYLATGDRPQRTGNRSLYFAPSGVYPTRDGRHVVITTPGEKFFAKVCRALGTDWDTDPRFHDIAARLANQDELDREMAARTRLFDRDALVERLVADDVLTAPINEVEDVVVDPQIRHNRMIVSTRHPVLGTVDVTGVPIRFYGTPCEVRRHAPMQGEHSREVLAELRMAIRQTTEGQALELLRSREDGEAPSGNTWRPVETGRPDRLAERLVGLVHSILGFAYRVEIRPVDAIPRGLTGKFEEFLSMLQS